MGGPPRWELPAPPLPVSRWPTTRSAHCSRMSRPLRSAGVRTCLWCWMPLLRWVAWTSATPAGWSLLTGWAGPWRPSLGRHSGDQEERPLAGALPDRRLPGGGRWPGVPDVPAIYAAAVALDCWLQSGRTVGERQHDLVDQLRAGIVQRVPDVDVAGDPVRRVPHLLTFSALWTARLDPGTGQGGLRWRAGQPAVPAANIPHMYWPPRALTHGNVRIGLTGRLSRGDRSVFGGVAADRGGDPRRWTRRERGRLIVRGAVAGLSRNEVPRPIIEVARRIGRSAWAPSWSCSRMTLPPGPTWPPGAACVGKRSSPRMRRVSSCGSES